MSPLLITAIILIFIAALTTLAYVHQRMEEKRERRQRLIRDLQKRLQELQQTQEQLPQWFQRDILADFLLEQQVRTMLQLERLQNRDFSKQRNGLKLYFQKLRNAEIEIPQLHAERQVQQLHQHLDQLHQLAVEAHRRKELTQQQTFALHQRLAHLKTASNYELFRQQARRSWEAEQNARLTEHYYTLARDELAKANNYGQYDATLRRLGEILQQLHGLSESVDDKERTSQLVSALDSQQIDDDPWKKKQLYDD